MTMNRNLYPCVEFDLDLLAENLAALVERCHDSLIEVAGVVKAVSALPEIVRVYEESGVKFIATSRVSQLRIMREAGLTKTADAHSHSHAFGASGRGGAERHQPAK